MPSCDRTVRCATGTGVFPDQLSKIRLFFSLLVALRLNSYTSRPSEQRAGPERTDRPANRPKTGWLYTKFAFGQTVLLILAGLAGQTRGTNPPARAAKARAP